MIGLVRAIVPCASLAIDVVAAHGADLAIKPETRSRSEAGTASRSGDLKVADVRRAVSPGKYAGDTYNPSHDGRTGTVEAAK